MKYGAEPGCACGRGHNLFGWFWSAEMQRIYDANLRREEALTPPAKPEKPLEPVKSLGDLFRARMEKK